MNLHINRYKLLSFILMILVVITVAGCDNGEPDLSDDAEFDVLIEVIDTDEEGLEDVSLELEDIDGSTQTAEATDETGIYEFLNVKLEKDSEFTVNIDKDGYQSESVDLIADSDTVKATGSEAITLEESDTESHKVTFIVEDENQDPVEDAKIEFNEDNKKSDEDGEAVFKDIETGNYSYSVSKDNFKDIKNEKIDVDDNQTVDISLEESTQDDPEFDVLIEVIDADTEEGLEDVSLELEDINGNIQTAEATDEIGVYEFENVKLEDNKEFEVSIKKGGYESERIKLFTEGDEITRIDENAVSLDQLNLGVPESFEFNMEGDNDTGTMTFNINNISDKNGNVFTGDLIGEKSSLKINYKKSKIKFYWYCSNEGYIHKATLFFDDIGFTDNNFDKWKEKDFSTSKKFSDTVYEEEGMAYIKKDWYDFIKQIHSFGQYEVILHLEFDKENVEIKSERLDYPIEDFEEFPVESASRAIVGTVTDENGDPVENAEVVIWTETDQSGLWHSPYLMTDENGNYGGSEYRKAAEGVYSITVEKEGYKKIERDFNLGVPADNIQDGNAVPAPEPKVIDFELEPAE